MIKKTTSLRVNNILEQIIPEIVKFKFSHVTISILNFKLVI